MWNFDKLCYCWQREPLERQIFSLTVWCAPVTAAVLFHADKCRLSFDPLWRSILTDWAAIMSSPSSESCSVFLLHTSGVLVRKNLTVSVNDKMFRFGDILDQISSICYSLFRKGLSCCEPVWISLCPLPSAVVRLYCILYLKSHCVWPRQAAAFSIFSVFSFAPFLFVDCHEWFEPPSRHHHDQSTKTLCRLSYR